jgi:Lon protease-like protein
MLNHDTWLPLFPLNTVLFPKGMLPLRVFEARYIDMVRNCMKDHAPFGVVLIKSGKEVGAPAEPESVGCLATIQQWDMAELGVLLLRTQGGERFRIVETRTAVNLLLEARVEMIAPDESGPVSDAHLACASALKTVIENINLKISAEQGAATESPFSQPFELENAGWVANRWCEILPISNQAKQKLLEVENGQGRLNIVYQYLQQHQII